MKDREAWHGAVHGVTKSRTQLSDRTTAATCIKKQKMKCYSHLVLNFRQRDTKDSVLEKVSFRLKLRGKKFNALTLCLRK